MPIINTILLSGSLLLVISLTVFYVECLSEIVSKQIKAKSWHTAVSKTVVLIPAHNEVS